MARVVGCGVDEPHAAEVPVARKTAADGGEWASGRGAVTRKGCRGQTLRRGLRFVGDSSCDEAGMKAGVYKNGAMRFPNCISGSHI